MYSLSEQEKGDLGLVLPKKFIEARNDAIAKGLIKDDNIKAKFYLEVESLGPGGLGSELLG
jgi:hypothetical protein